MTISLPPTAPSRQDPATFSDRADAFAAWLVNAVPQFNDLAVGSIDSGNFQSITVAGQITGNAVTQSAIDTTAGRVTKVGDYGFGLDAPRMPDDDPDLMGTSGVYSTVGADPAVAGSNGEALAHFRTTSERGFYITSRRDDGDLVFRIKNGVWGDITRVYSTKNILGTVSQSGGVPIGAVIQRGSGPNGFFVRLADGTQICWRIVTHDFDSNSSQNWDFQAAFADIDEVAGSWALSQPSLLQIDLIYTRRFAAWVRTDTPQWRTRAGEGATVAETVDVTLVAIGRWF